jgi:hypothetical protein
MNLPALLKAENVWSDWPTLGPKDSQAKEKILFSNVTKILLYRNIVYDKKFFFCY